MSGEPLWIGGVSFVEDDVPDTIYDANENIAMPRPSPTFQRRIDEYVNFINGRRDRNVRSPEGFARLKRNMEWVYGRNTLLFCVDIEAWERNTNVITEIGVSIYDPEEQEFAITPVIHTYHIIIQQHQHKRNGRFVPDHMHNFMEGQLVLLPMNEATKLLQLLIDKYFGEWAKKWCTFVGHDLRNDIDYLAKIGIHVPPKILTLDTQTLFAYSHGKYGASLQNALRTVKQPFAFLHNAGNDAYYTVLLALKLCDPNARLLLGLDLLGKGENVGDRKEYLKTPKNTSIAEYVSPAKILADLGE